MPLSPELQNAVNAANAGDRVAARKILKQILRDDPNNETAWFLYAQVADNPEHVIASLNKVLDLNPYNDRARKMLEQVKPREEPKPDPNAPWDYNKHYDKQRSAKSEEEIPVKKRIPILFFAIAAIVVFVLFISIGGYVLARKALTPPPTPTVFFIRPTITPTPETCTCDNAREYINRTITRYNELGAEAEKIGTALENNTITADDVNIFVATANARYDDQRAETPPPCLDTFQKKTVQVFWSWHQASMSLQSNDVNAMLTFLDNFVATGPELDTEIEKLNDRLGECIVPFPTPEQ